MRTSSWSLRESTYSGFIFTQPLPGKGGSINVHKHPLFVNIYHSCCYKRSPHLFSCQGSRSKRGFWQGVPPLSGRLLHSEPSRPPPWASETRKQETRQKDTTWNGQLWPHTTNTTMMQAKNEPKRWNFIGRALTTGLEHKKNKPKRWCSI